MTVAGIEVRRTRIHGNRNIKPESEAIKINNRCSHSWLRME